MGKIKNRKWRGTKAEFVRSMPRVSTGAVIRYAASVGLRLSSLDVARARYKERAATRSEAVPAAPKTADAEAAAAVRPARKNRRAAKPASKNRALLMRAIKKMQTWPGTKSDFVRTMPGARIADVQAAAKRAGVVLSKQAVSAVRYLDRKSGKSVRELFDHANREARAQHAVIANLEKISQKFDQAAKTQKFVKGMEVPLLAAKPRAAAVKKWTGTTAEFIRSMPSASAKDVQAAARRAGIRMSWQYVNVVRSEDRKRTPAWRRAHGPLRANPKTRVATQKFVKGVEVPLLAAKPRRGTKARVEPVIVHVDHDRGVVTAGFAKKFVAAPAHKHSDFAVDYSEKIAQVSQKFDQATKTQNSVTDAIESLKRELTCTGCQSAQQIAGIARDVENNADLDQREAFFLLLSLGSKGLRDALQDASERAVLRPKNNQRQQVAKLAARLGARVIAQLIAGVERGLASTSG